MVEFPALSDRGKASTPQKWDSSRWYCCYVLHDLVFCNCPFIELIWHSDLLLSFYGINDGRRTDQDGVRWARTSGVSGVKVKQTQVFVNCVYYFAHFINTDWRNALLKIHYLNILGVHLPICNAITVPCVRIWGQFSRGRICRKCNSG